MPEAPHLVDDRQQRIALAGELVLDPRGRLGVAAADDDSLLLERQGVLIRRSYPESPPRVEYELTDKGRALLPFIRAMLKFGHEWLVTEPAPGRRAATC